MLSPILSLFRTPGARAGLLGLLLVASPAAGQDAELQATLSKALALHQAGDLEGAASLYIQVLRAVPQAFRVRSNLGAAWAGLGRYEDAIDQYQQALAVEDDPAVRHNLAVALLKTGRAGEAALQSRRVLDAQPGNRDALLLLAECQLRQGEDESAVALLRGAPVALQDDKAVAYLLGTALLNLDRLGEAQSVMDRVLKGDTPEGHVLLGSMYSRRGDWTAALGGVREGAGERGEAAARQLPLRRGAHEGAQRLGGGRGRFPGGARRRPEPLRVEPAARHAAARGGRHEEALVYLDRAARLHGDDLAVKFSLGAALLATGRMEEARRLLEDVSAAAPGHLPTQMQLALLYTRLGRPEDAARRGERRAPAERRGHAVVPGCARVDQRPDGPRGG